MMAVFVLFMLCCRWLVIRWRLWTWPPYSGRTCCTSRRAQRRSSAWRARHEWRTALLSSAWCSSWSTRTSPCSRYITHAPWPYDWDMRMLSQRKYINKNKSPLLWLFVMTVLWKCLRCSLCQHSPLACPKKGCWDDLDHLSLNEGQVCLQNRNMQGF